MTWGALPNKVVVWSPVCVAALTIRVATMVKDCPLPACGRMALRALPVEVVGGYIHHMASQTIGVDLMVEDNTLPAHLRMACRTLPIVVVYRGIRGMTALAIHGTCYRMIEIYFLPADWGVTRGAITANVICRFDFRVTLLAGIVNPAISPLGMAGAALQECMHAG